MDTARYFLKMAFLWYLFIACNDVPPPLPVMESVLQLIDTSNGDFAVAFHDLQSGEKVMIREQESFHAASTMKTPVMIEAFKYMKTNGLKLTDSLSVYNRFNSIIDSSEFSLTPDQDGDKALYDSIDINITWYDMIHRMITRSSNLATNILIDMLNAQNVTKTMRELGAPNIQVLRGVEDLKAFEVGLNNTTTAYDLLVIYEKLAKYEVVDSASSQAMLNILFDQEFNSLIPSRLPRDVRVAHKTGSITGVHHDSGIVFLPDGRKYVLVLMSKNVQDMEKANASMSAISRLLYDYVQRKKIGEEYVSEWEDGR